MHIHCRYKSTYNAKNENNRCQDSKGHLQYPDETPLANLFVTLLDKMSVPVDHFGDSTGRLEGLSGV